MAPGSTLRHQSSPINLASDTCVAPRVPGVLLGPLSDAAHTLMSRFHQPTVAIRYSLKGGFPIFLRLYAS